MLFVVFKQTQGNKCGAIWLWAETTTWIGLMEIFEVFFEFQSLNHHGGTLCIFFLHSYIEQENVSLNAKMQRASHYCICFDVWWLGGFRAETFGPVCVCLKFSCFAPNFNWELDKARKCRDTIFCSSRGWNKYKLHSDSSTCRIGSALLTVFFWEKNSPSSWGRANNSFVKWLRPRSKLHHL